MSAITAVASHLNIAEQAIVEIQEWASVLWVRFVSGRPRFVSKKVAKMSDPKKITYTYPGGQKMELLATKQGFYQVYVDGVYHSKETIAKVLKGFEALTDQQKQDCNLKMYY